MGMLDELLLDPRVMNAIGGTGYWTPPNGMPLGAPVSPGMLAQPGAPLAPDEGAPAGAVAGRGDRLPIAPPQPPGPPPKLTLGDLTDPTGYTGGGMPPLEPDPNVTTVMKDIPGNAGVRQFWPDRAQMWNTQVAPPPAPPPIAGGTNIKPAPVVAGAPDDGAALPPNSNPTAEIPNTAPAAAPVAPPAGVPSTSLLGRLNEGLANNSATLMMMGAGLAGGKSFGDSISGALQGAVRGGQLDQQQQAQNQTAKFLVSKIPGITNEDALALARNPDVMKQLLPQMFGGKKLMNVNGVLVDEATGRKVADYSEATKWQVAKVTDPNTGLETSVLVQPGTGAVKSLHPSNLTPSTGQGGPATGNMSIPPEVRALPPSQQFRDAPDGSTATLGGRPAVKRNGRWEYVQ